MQTAVLDSFVAFACCTLSFSSREKWVLYTLTVKWGMEDICTWINCILTTVRQLRISESCRHELFLFVTCKLSLAFVYSMYYCDPMAGYQGELVIKKSERAGSFSYRGRGQEIRWNILFVLSHIHLLFQQLLESESLTLWLRPLLLKVTVWHFSHCLTLHLQSTWKVYSSLGIW